MSTETDTQSPTEQSSHQKTITIHIDKEAFKVAEGPITAEALRLLPRPPIGPDRDLYLEVHGPGDDLLIEPGTTVVVEEGMHFFTAPATITPGHAR